jgi:hypothetical protein
MVGAPVFFDAPGFRAIVALFISVFFLVLQVRYQPYHREEHNILAELAMAQLTVSLFVVAMHAVGARIPQTVGFGCIILNVILVPTVLYFNAR